MYDLFNQKVLILQNVFMTDYNFNRKCSREVSKKILWCKFLLKSMI